MGTKDLKVKISADIKNFNNAIKEIDNGMQNATKSISGITKAGESIKSVGSALTKSVTLPVVAAGAASSKLYLDFDNAMREVAGTMGITAKEIEQGSESYKKLEEAARECGKNTQFSATESAEALNYLALAGYDVDTAIAMLPKTLNLAAAGNLDLAQATDMVTDSASALSLDIQGTERLIDQMAKTSQKSNTNIAQLGEGILTVGGTAKYLAGGTTELNTALGILADNGIKGAEGGTALRNVILSLAAPMDKAKDCMDNLGLSVFDAQGKMRPLNEIFKDLDSKLGEMSESERINVLNTIFNKVDLKSVNALLANSGERFDFLSGEIDNANGTAEQMAETMNSGLGGALKEMKSALEEAGLAIGEVLAPVIKNLAEFIKDLSLKFSELSPNTKKFIVVAAGLAAILGPILVLIGGLIVTFGALSAASIALNIGMLPLTGTILLVVAVIGAVIAIGALLIANWDTIKSKASELGEKISEIWNNIKQWTSDTWNNVKESISQAWEAVKTKTSEIWDNCVEVVSEAWEWIKLAVQAGIQFIGDLIGLAFDIITLPWQFIWQNCGEYIIQAWDWIKTTISDALNFVGDKIKEGWDNVMSVTQPIWDTITGFISEKWDQLKSWASEKFNAIKDAVSQAWEQTKSASSQAWGIITGALSDKWNEIKDKASERFNAVKDTVSNAWNSIRDTTSSVWGNVKDSVSKAWDNIKDTVKKGVDKLKSLVNFKWELPKLKMPHITTSGKFSLNPPSVPHFGIEWKSAGGIFRRPTVLGSGYGVGDKHRGAGSNMEAVLPLNKLPELLGLDKNKSNGLMINIEQFTNNTDADIENICNRIAFELKRRRVV